MKRKNYQVQSCYGANVVKHAFNAGVAAAAQMAQDYGKANKLLGTWIRESAEILKHDGVAVAGFRVWRHFETQTGVRIVIKLQADQLPEGALDNPAIKAYYPEVV